MKNINPKELKDLLLIIQEAPMQRIGHFTSLDFELSNLLCEFCQINEYEYILNSTDKNSIQYLKEKYKDYNLTKVKPFDSSKKSYLQNGLFYEYLFVSIEIPNAQKNIFLQKSHKCIKNAGLIIIFTTDNPVVPKADIVMNKAFPYVRCDSMFIHGNVVPTRFGS